MKKDGSFIVFEGIDGAGKSCQLQQTADFLRQRGFSVATTREPGGTAISEKIRSVLLDAENRNMDDYCELLLYAASRAQHLAEVILPALERGEAVLCDRFQLSTIAYQGYGRGLPLNSIRAVNALGADRCRPDLTFVIDVPVEVGFDRIRENRDAPRDRLEQEKAAFFQRVRQGYLAEAAAAEDIVVIDGNAEAEQVFAVIVKELEQHL